jgi:hypothetical protein
MRFVLVKGESQYGSLRLHVDQLAAALRASGEIAEIIDLTAPDAAERLIAATAQPTDCVFGFNGVGGEIATPGRVFERPQFGYASLYVDHPVHHLERLSAAIPRQAVFFLDRSHVDFVRRWAPPDAFAYVGFLPPGANTLPEPVDTSDAAFAARDIGLLFTGTYRGAPSEPWADWPQSPARILVAETAGRMTARGRTTLLDAATETLSAAGGVLTPELVGQAAPLLALAQTHVEASLRHKVLVALGEAGVAVEVRGAGWAPLCAAYPSLHHGGLGSFEETLALLRRARLVLNINNGFVAGGHERVFTALCAGAAVVSEASDYYDEAFGPNELMTYDIDRPGEVAARLNSLAADPTGQAALARAGHARAEADHRWTNRAAKLGAAIRALG